jgi:hypothetical protein
MTDEHTNGHEAAADPADGEPNAAQEKTAGAIASAVTAPLKLIPWRTTITKKLLGASLKQYHKLGGGHALGLIAEPGQRLQLRPIQYRAPKDCEDGERPGWVEKGGDKVWHAGSEGRVVDRLGKVPVVALERDGHVEAGWLKSRIGQAIELDNYDGVYTQPQINAEVVANLDGPGQAIADGGEQIANVSMADLGSYRGAELIDLGSGEGYDGMRIDFRKASDWAFETTSTEEMQMQEERGILLGQLRDTGPSATKLFLYAALFALAAIGLAVIGPELLAGSGGGGGGINPLTVLAAAGVP